VEIRLDGKNALVTGASSGIGRAIALALAAAGADVAINYRSNAAGAEETARQVHETGHRSLTIQADVGDPVQVATMFGRFDAELGSIDILVANAGHGSPTKPLHETTWEEWERVLRSNLHGVFLCGGDGCHERDRGCPCDSREREERQRAPGLAATTG
jgi:glucose 1-dehydrogenase